MASRRNPFVNSRIGFWQAFRDIMVMSMTKGQFPVALIGLVIISFIVKMSSNDVSRLAFEILELFKSFHLVGWTIGIVASIGWLLHTKFQRRTIDKEMKRISVERDSARAELLARKSPLNL